MLFFFFDSLMLYFGFDSQVFHFVFHFVSFTSLLKKRWKAVDNYRQQRHQGERRDIQLIIKMSIIHSNSSCGVLHFLLSHFPTTRHTPCQTFHIFKHSYRPMFIINSNNSLVKLPFQSFSGHLLVCVKSATIF